MKLAEQSARAFSVGRIRVMRGVKKHYVALFRTGPASVGIVLLVGLGALVLSCDEVERHQVLAFFLDGVPPLSPQDFEEGLANSNSQELEQGGQKPAWYVHEPRKDCTNCHQKQRMGRFSAQTHLVAPVPALCHRCHPDFTASASFVHGPVAVGQCLFCHNPHKSKIEHLLNEPEPKLCYLCHDISMVELIPAHLTQQTSACTDCHNPHAGPTKALLKGPSQTAGPVAPGRMTDTTAQDDIQRLKERNADAAPWPPERTDRSAIGRNKVFEVFWEVARLIEQGDLKNARARLEVLKDNQALTVEEREKILNVLRLMDDASAGDEQRSGKDKQGRPLPERKVNDSGTKSGKNGDSMTSQEQEVADLYYRSMAFYRDGQLTRAREGFVSVLKSGLIPDPMAETIRGYVSDIDRALAGDNTPPARKQ